MERKEGREEWWVRRDRADAARAAWEERYGRYLAEVERRMAAQRTPTDAEIENYVDTKLISVVPERTVHHLSSRERGFVHTGRDDDGGDVTYPAYRVLNSAELRNMYDGVASRIRKYMRRRERITDVERRHLIKIVRESPEIYWRVAGGENPFDVEVK